MSLLPSVRVTALVYICGLFLKYRLNEPSLYDKSGQVKLRLQSSQRAHSFSEGLAAVSVNSKWGFINSSGQFVIPPQFGWVGDFSEGLALVTPAPADQYWKKDTLFGYIDHLGQYAIPARFNWAVSFSEGLAAVCIGPCRNDDLSQARNGYIDHSGAFVLPPRYAEAGPFSEGLASAAEKHGPHAMKGFIDKAGAFVVKPRFMWADEFANGLAATNYGYVNHQGEVVIARHPTNQGGAFSGGWAAVLDDKGVVFVDTTGRVTLKPDCEAVGPFSEDLAPACRSNCGPSAIGAGQNWGYIDKSGRFVIRPQFGSRPEAFRNGLALVCFGCKG